jgi:short-subunit dehydrogenase
MSLVIKEKRNSLNWEVVMEPSKTILVTGASSGIGLEMARILATRSHRLILVSRSKDKLEVVANELRQHTSTEVITYAVDLSDPASAEHLFDFCEAQQLQIDILINNAGFGIFDEHVAMDQKKLTQMLQLNVIAVAALCQIFGAQMKRRRSGAILNVASTAAYQATPYFAAYGASKSFVLCFSEALAKELEDFDVQVSCLAPGPTDTAFFDAMDPKQIADGHMFQKGGRTDVRSVAQAGVDLLDHGGMTSVVGFANRLAVLGNRFLPRSIVASVSKRLLKPMDKNSAQ